jgi:hypothetical protein
MMIDASPRKPSILKSAFTVPKAPVVHGDDEPEKPVVVRKPPGPRWLADEEVHADGELTVLEETWERADRERVRVRLGPGQVGPRR